MVELIEEYREVKECVFKGEHYLVRDNGAVKRSARTGGRKRKLDETWTFGEKNAANGYMYIGTHRIHQIVATAFYGARDSKIYVVDHMDTNRCNNRVENLQWLTRLENALANPATRKKIEYLCGSLERFLEDPTCLRVAAGENQDIAWMRTVSADEAAAAKANIEHWAKMPNKDSTTRSALKVSDKSWIFKKLHKADWSMSQARCHEEELVAAAYPPSAVQLKWRIPSRFPLCPESVGETPLVDYMMRLSVGAVFSVNEYTSSVIQKFALSEDKKKIVVWCTVNTGIKGYAVASVYVENDKFIHKSVGTAFEDIGADWLYAEERGLPYDGPKGVDYYCG